MKKRLKHDVRKEQIIDAALDIAERSGLAALSRDAIAREINVTGQTINYYYGTMRQLERAVKRAAVAKGRLRVIAQLIVCNDPTAEGVDDATRAAALRAFK